jgi:FkbM family methyltransferase
VTNASSSAAQKRSPPLNPLGLAALGLGLFVAGATAAAVALTPLIKAGGFVHPEAEQFAGRYGPAQYSQFGEEWMIRDFFDGKRDGVFVDVGASDYKEFSNTYYLEMELGWSGLAIDPLPQFAEDYRRHRPRTKFRSFFVSDASNEQARIYYLQDDSRVTSARPEFTGRFGAGAIELSSPTITLNDLLDKEGVTKVDFLSMDIELAEPKALAGFDIERFQPDLVCIEGHEEVRQTILNYFARHGYVVVGKYLRADVVNLYFTPLTGAGQ